MDIQLYSRNGCYHCENTKKILQSRQIPFTEIKIDVDIDVAVVKEKYPQANTLPIIVVDGNWISHLSELRYILEKK